MKDEEKSDSEDDKNENSSLEEEISK